jgi:hypothetical protein
MVTLASLAATRRGTREAYLQTRMIVMPNASKKHIGAGAQGKRDGSGAMSELDKDLVPENMILSNRDKSRHTDERGLDSKWVQTEQYQDHPEDRIEG